MAKYNNFEIGAPCSPSYLVSKKSEKCLRIIVTAGGGIGCSFWEEFGTTNDDVKNGGFITFKDVITKKTKKINTAFIVEVEEVQVVKSVWNTTPWANCNKKVCEKQTQTIYYYFPPDAKVSVLDSYICNEKIQKRMVKKIVDEE